MFTYLKPHTEEWFKALENANPRQAAHVREIISLSGSTEVCSMCGDETKKDYKYMGPGAAKAPVTTARLCDDCVEIRRSMHDEQFELISS